jgi:hypothetical protein
MKFIPVRRIVVDFEYKRRGHCLGTSGELLEGSAFGESNC